jgi:hypothetical protein
VGVASSFGDTSPAALQAVKYNAEMLAWAASCFIVAIAVIVTTQIVYTDEVIIKVLNIPKAERDWPEKIVRIAFAIFAWTALALQIAGMFLIAQSLALISSQSMQMARYGIVGGGVLVAGMFLLGILSQGEVREKIFGGKPVVSNTKVLGA